MVTRTSRPVFGTFLLPIATAFLAGCTSIQEAARKGDVQEVRRLLDSGVNVNSQGFYPYISALHRAAAEGHVEVVKLLLERGANPNIRQESGVPPLAYAAYGGHVEVMELLLAHGADPRIPEVVDLAARGGHVEAFEVLLGHGLDINMKGTDEYTALGTAVNHRRRELVKFLLARGANVNARALYGCTPLFAAYQSDDVVIGRILLDHGADPTLECNGAKIPQSFVDKLRQDVRQGPKAGSAGKKLDKTIRTDHLLCHYSEGDSVDGKRYEAFLTWFTAQTGISPPKGIQIFKYRDLAHMQRMTRNAVNGYAIPDKLEVHTIWPFDPHELVHVLVEHQARRPAPFFAEGTAMAYDVDPLAGRYRPIWHSKDLDALARAYRDGGKIPPLAALLEARSFRKLDDSLTYPIAGSFVRHLNTTHGADNLLALLHRITGQGSARAIRAAFQSVYGAPLDQEWQEWLKSLS